SRSRLWSQSRSHLSSCLRFFQSPRSESPFFLPSLARFQSRSSVSLAFLASSPFRALSALPLSWGDRSAACLLWYEFLLSSDFFLSSDFLLSALLASGFLSSPLLFLAAGFVCSGFLASAFLASSFWSALGSSLAFWAV